MHAWLLVCDAVVSWNSTVMLEAVLFKKCRVYALRIRGSANAEEYISGGIAVGVNNSDELFNLLQDLLSGSKKGKVYQLNAQKYVFQSEKLHV